MGRKGRKRPNNKNLGKRDKPFEPKGKEGNKTQEIDDRDTAAGSEVKDNIYIREFYKEMLKSDFPTEEDFENFMEILKSPLPVSFRVNPTYPNHKRIIEILNNNELITKYFFGEVEGYKELEEKKAETLHENKVLVRSVTLKRALWYPKELVYHLNASKNELKKVKRLKKFHKLLQLSGDCGLLTRQELVSMIPPLFLNIEKGDLVLDMCAAPGSKTTQILEILSSDSSVGTCVNALKSGGVIANDMNKKRAYMLTHQLKRINFPGMGVINHEGQFIPTVYDNSIQGKKFDKKVYFDKVLVDVPCSGDGAIRKLPMRWRLWKTKDAFELHSVQVKLLKRAIQLAKVGGRVVYSTCSMNPVENEAVITEVLKSSRQWDSNKNEPSLELVDLHTEENKLKGFISRKGKKTWPILIQKKPLIDRFNLEDNSYELNDLFHVYTEFDPDARNYHAKINQSMFPLEESEMENLKIERVMRILPHDQDTGGFFVAVFQKNSIVYFEENNKPENKENEDMDEEEDIGVTASKEQAMEEEMHENEEEGDGEDNKEKEQHTPALKVREDQMEYLKLNEAMPDHWKILKEYYELDDVR